MTASGSAERLAQAAESIVGSEHVRPAQAEDRVDGASPRVIVEPADAESAGAVLAWASRDRVPLVVRGSGTKLDWGPPLRASDVLLSTAGLGAILEHRHGDLTATVQAGARLAAVNGRLARARQCIPLDPPFSASATIGGILATNDSGPRRQRYGAPRDQIIGVTIARTDGRLARSGGIVVKNVAGYDLARLMTGSYGTLALIVDATFKLAPTSQASKTVILTPGSLDTLGAIGAELAASPLVPTAVELEMPPGRLLVRFETAPRAVDQQASDVVAMAARRGVQWAEASGEAEATLWRAHADRPWNQPGCVCKVSMLPDDLVPFVRWLRDLPELPSWELVGRAALGVLLLRFEGGIQEREALVAQIRARAARGRAHLSLLRAEPELKARQGAWDEPADTLPLMRAIKREFDPAGVLNAGRGPGGV